MFFDFVCPDRNGPAGVRGRHAVAIWSVPDLAIGNHGGTPGTPGSGLRPRERPAPLERIVAVGEIQSERDRNPRGRTVRAWCDHELEWKQESRRGSDDHCRQHPATSDLDPAGILPPHACDQSGPVHLQPEGSGTTVGWTMTRKNGFFGKSFCLVGSDFKKGLANRKAIVEKSSTSIISPGR